MFWEDHRGKRIRFEIPGKLVFQDYYGSGRSAGIRLQDEVNAWCREQKIQYRKLRGTCIMANQILGPFSVDMHEHHAIHFKMRWF